MSFKTCILYNTCKIIYFEKCWWPKLYGEKKHSQNIFSNTFGMTWGRVKGGQNYISLVFTKQNMQFITSESASSRSLLSLSNLCFSLSANLLLRSSSSFRALCVSRASWPTSRSRLICLLPRGVPLKPSVVVRETSSYISTRPKNKNT